MARHIFGGDIASYVVAVGNPETVGSISGDHALLVPSQVVTFWNAATGGSQITDLQDMLGTAITAVTTDTNGAIPQLQGPVTTPDTWSLWADANGGAGPRRLMVASDLSAMDTKKLDAAGGTLSGPLGISTGQGSASVLTVTNTTATPTVPAQVITAAAAGDKAFGIQVAGDTNRRLHADSNGVLAWGSGSGTQDVNWYRIAAGIVGTDNTVQTGTLRGSAASAGTLTLSSTGHATKGNILFGSSAYDEAHNRLGLGTTSPAWLLDVAGVANFQAALQFANAVKTASYTATANDTVILASAASASVTITLPSASGVAGRPYLIGRTDTTYANSVTIATTSSQTINGATTYTSLWAQYTYVIVVSDGANWQVFGASNIPEPWQTMSLQNGWSNQGGTNVTAKFRRLIIGRLEVIGLITHTSITGGSIIATLTAPYLPARDQIIGGIAGVTNSAQAYLTISASAGTLTLNNLSSSTNVGFNGSYSLDA